MHVLRLISLKNFLNFFKGIDLASLAQEIFHEVEEISMEKHRTKKGKIEYFAFPKHLEGRYQSFTEADISALRTAGYDKPFKTVEEGVKAYMDWLNA